MVANEFLDAFPVKRFTRDGTEQKVGLQEDRLTLIPDETEGCYEQAPSIESWMKGFLVLMKARHGAALIIDYAHTTARADTVQALHRHAPVGLLDKPGESDLTAHVNYAPLMRLGAEMGFAVPPLLSQRDFLLHYGLSLRLEQLCRHADPQQARTLQEGAARLIDSSAMGSLFQVLQFMI
jgi:SAM-dependent MidA family methyltransferase